MALNRKLKKAKNYNNLLSRLQPTGPTMFVFHLLAFDASHQRREKDGQTMFAANDRPSKDGSKRTVDNGLILLFFSKLFLIGSLNNITITFMVIVYHVISNSTMIVIVILFNKPIRKGFQEKG